MEEFYGRLPRRLRRHLKATKLQDDFPARVRIALFRDTKDLDRMFRDIEQVAKTTYQRGLGVGFEDTPAMRDRMKLAAEKGWLRAYVLYVLEKPCAFWVGTLYQDLFHSSFTGYDAAYGKYTPGMYLILTAIQGFFEQGNGTPVRAVDFGLGDAEWKQDLADSEWLDWSGSIYAATLRGVTLNVLGMITRKLNELGANFLERTKYLNKAKKLWRNRLREA